jgi:small multidrug resistance pump
MAYLYLFGAILFEVTATLLLPLSKNFTKPILSIGILTSYSISFYLLTYAVKGIPIAIAYSTWAGVGILLITLFGYVFYHQSLQWQSLIGLVLIVLGVSIVNIFKNTNIH